MKKLFLLLVLCLLGCITNQQKALDLNRTSDSGSSNSNYSADNNSKEVVLTIEEVAKHSTYFDCWVVIDGKVLDLSYFTYHPGGDVYVPFCGKDGTQAFKSIKNGKGHSKKAYDYMNNFIIGRLGEAVILQNSK